MGKRGDIRNSPHRGYRRLRRVGCEARACPVPFLRHEGEITPTAGQLLPRVPDNANGGASRRSTWTTAGYKIATRNLHTRYAGFDSHAKGQLIPYG